MCSILFLLYLRSLQKQTSDQTLSGFFLQIRECLGQLAVSTEDETQWKYLNYQVLLCIRNNDLKVRILN
jgi:hypothetical protein